MAQRRWGFPLVATQGDWGGAPDLIHGGGGAWRRRPEGEMAAVARGRIASTPLDGAHHMGAGAAAPGMAAETSAPEVDDQPRCDL